MTRFSVRGYRVYLRPPRTEDLDSFLDAVRRSRKLHRPWTHPPSDRVNFEGYLRHVASPRREGFLVCREENDAFVGVINVSEIVRGNFQSAYLGFYALAPHAGVGYMTEGLELTSRFAFRELRLHRLEANIQPENTRSKALAERCGFRKEGFSPRYLKIGGRWCDHERWALLADDWVARPRREKGAT